jgi:hypothetical protein
LITIIAGNNSNNKGKYRHCTAVHDALLCMQLIFLIHNLFLAKYLPFRIGVSFDGAEEGGLTDMAASNERFEDPGGITGFQLQYWQIAC